MAKEKSVTELRDEQNVLAEDLKKMLTNAKNENRDLSSDEQKDRREKMYRLDEINIDIVKLQSINNAGGRQHSAPSNGFSLRKAIVDVIDGKMSDETAAMREEARKSGLTMEGQLQIPMEMREDPVQTDFMATGTNEKGKSIIDKTFTGILSPLRDRMVLSQAGATFLTGLKGNIEIPAYSGATAEWAGEGVTAAEGGGEFSGKTMSPKRLPTYIDISKQLLLQDTLGVEQMLRNDLVAAIASKLEATILGAHTAAATKPNGLFTGYAGAAKSFTWDNIVDLEGEVDLNNALIGGSYVMHTKLRSYAKKIIKKADSGGGFVLDPDGTLNGYKALRTNAVSIKSHVDSTTEETVIDGYGVLFGNFAELLVGQWGPIDLLIDPYSRGRDGVVRIVVNSFWDAIVRRSGAIAKAYMLDGTVSAG